MGRCESAVAEKLLINQCKGGAVEVNVIYKDINTPKYKRLEVWGLSGSQFLADSPESHIARVTILVSVRTEVVSL